MTAVLLIGLGHIGAKHLGTLRTFDELTICGIVEQRAEVLETTDLRGIPQFRDVTKALAATRPDLAIVATPPNVALTIATVCARHGATVLVEKPVVVDVEQHRAAIRKLEPYPVFVAFQPHFARGIAALLGREHWHQDAGLRVLITLDCRRHRHYYSGWRAHYDSAGGVLHQQAIHAIALAMRFWPVDDPIAMCRVVIINRRPWKTIEDEVHASVVFQSGRELQIAASVDSLARDRHTLILLASSGEAAVINGRNLERGVLGSGPRDDQTHEALRASLYRALLASLSDGV
ncbi:MAG: Gfo/Idh/MocA family protein [Sciscionella sp.]